jgi:glycosyltransferase involved in cell wall biosynthesis
MQFAILIMTESSKKIRVLFVTDEMEVGGTQRQIVHIARSLDPIRFEPTVVYFCNRSFLVDDLEKAGVRVLEVPKRGRIDVGFVRRFVTFLQDGKFDVMHCFAFSGELWGAIARRLVPANARPALITSVRNKYDWYSPLQWRVKRWTALESSQVIANSRAGGEHARERMRLPPASVNVVYNGVADISVGLPLMPPRIDGDLVRILFVGRLVEQKNVPVLLRAIKRLADQHDAGKTPFRVRLAGDGPLRGALEAQVSALGISDVVEFLGERSDTAALMASSDFVVSPSFREGLSNVILEAMMVGRPVIASAVGGSVELIEQNGNGLLFASDDEAELADAMRKLAGDAALRKRLGETGRQHAVQRYTVAAMVKTMESYYSACANEVAH